MTERTTIEHNGKQYELTGEIRPPCEGEPFVFTTWAGKIVVSFASAGYGKGDERPILREVEPPAPFPVTYVPDGFTPNPVVVEATPEFVDLTDQDDEECVTFSRVAAIDLARRILQHYEGADE